LLGFGGVGPLPGHPRSLAPAGLQTKGDGAGLADEANGTPGGKRGEPTAKAGGHVSISIVQGVGCDHARGRCADALRNDDRHDQSVDTQHAGHDNRDDVFNNALGIVDAHLADAETRFPRSPRRSPVGENHARSGTEVAEERGVVRAGVEAGSYCRHGEILIPKGCLCAYARDGDDDVGSAMALCSKTQLDLLHELIMSFILMRKFAASKQAERALDQE